MSTNLIVQKSPDECLKIIKDAVPNYYHRPDIGNLEPISRYKYTEDNDYLSVISSGIGYIPVVFYMKMIIVGENETRITGSFSVVLLLRLIVWILTSFMFSFALLFLLSVLTGDMPLNFTDVILPCAAMMVSMGYLVYSEKARKREKKAIVSLVTELFFNSAN